MAVAVAAASMLLQLNVFKMHFTCTPISQFGFEIFHTQRRIHSISFRFVQKLFTLYECAAKELNIEAYTNWPLIQFRETKNKRFWINESRGKNRALPAIILINGICIIQFNSYSILDRFPLHFEWENKLNERSLKWRTFQFPIKSRHFI